MNLFARSAALGALTLLCASSSLHAGQARGYTAVKLGLELEGAAVGFVSVVQGGNAVGSVVKEPDGEESFVKKHLDNVGYHDIVIEFGADMAPAVFDWIKLALQREYAPKNGAIVTLDLNGTARSRLEFAGAQITEVTFPSADAAATKDSVRFIVRLTPISTTLNRTPSPSPTLFGGAKKGISANTFSFTINGITGLNFVSKVEQITVKLPRLIDPSLVCAICEPTPTPPIDFPAIVFTLAESRADPVYQWFNDFVLNGNSEDSAERTGALNFLASGSPRFTLNFSHLGIFEIASITDGTIMKVAVSMYCEQISFEYF